MLQWLALDKRLFQVSQPPITTRWNGVVPRPPSLKPIEEALGVTLGGPRSWKSYTGSWRWEFCAGDCYSIPIICTTESPLRKVGLSNDREVVVDFDLDTASLGSNTRGRTPSCLCESRRREFFDGNCLGCSYRGFFMAQDSGNTLSWPKDDLTPLRRLEPYFFVLAAVHSGILCRPETVYPDDRTTDGAGGADPYTRGEWKRA